VSYKTAWYLCHRIRKAMAEANPRRLKGTVELDETYIGGNAHINTIENAWSLFKRSLIGSYHKVSAKHLDAYLDEFEWRFNNRKNPFLFRDTMIKLIASSNVEYKNLTARAKDAA